MKAQTFGNGNDELATRIAAAEREIAAFATLEASSGMRVFGIVVQRDVMVTGVTFDPPTRVHRVLAGQRYQYFAPLGGEVHPAVSRIDFIEPRRVLLGNSVFAHCLGEQPPLTMRLLWDRDYLIHQVRENIAAERLSAFRHDEVRLQVVEKWLNLESDPDSVPAIKRLLMGLAELGFSPFSYKPHCPRCGAFVDDAGPARAPFVTPPLCRMCSRLQALAPTGQSAT